MGRERQKPGEVGYHKVACPQPSSSKTNQNSSVLKGENDFPFGLSRSSCFSYLQ